MAAESGFDSADLAVRLRNEPFRFGFFQALRLLGLIDRKPSLANGRKLRLRTPLALEFQPSELLRWRSARGEQTEELEVGFMGLTGPAGVLPATYTELLIERRLTHRDDAPHAFLDIFSHRALMLFHAAWTKYRFYIGYEAGDRGGFTQHLMDLLAIGTARTPESGVPVGLLAFFAGSLGRRPLPSRSLANLLESYFQVAVVLEQFVGQWIEISSDGQSGLGASSGALGEGAFLGQRLLDRQTKLRLRLGPMDLERFLEFQPERSAGTMLRRLLEACLGPSLNCDITLVLARASAPPASPLGGGVHARLGVSTWLRTEPPRRDLDDFCFRIV